MKPLLVLATSIPIMLLNVGISIGEPMSAGSNWSSTPNFQSAYSKSAKDARADLMAQAESGYYSSFTTEYVSTDSSTTDDNDDQNNPRGGNCRRGNGGSRGDSTGTSRHSNNGTTNCTERGE